MSVGVPGMKCPYAVGSGVVRVTGVEVLRRRTYALAGEVRCSGVVRRASSARGGLARGRVAQGLVYSSTTPHMISRRGHVPLSDLVIGTLPVM